MRLGVDLLQGHGLTTVAVIHTAWRFIVHMNDLCLRDVGNSMSLLLRPFCPGEILQPCQFFIIGILLPETFSYGGIRIVAKRSFLAQLAHIRKPLLKDLLL